jgi:hypothetical protein
MLPSGSWQAGVHIRKTICHTRRFTKWGGHDRDHHNLNGASHNIRLVLQRLALDCGIEALSGPPQTRSAGPSYHHAVGRNETKLSTHFDHLPAALMHEAMVEVAEQDQVGQLLGPSLAQAMM